MINYNKESYKINNICHPQRSEELDLRKTSLQRCNRCLLSCNTDQFNKPCVTQVKDLYDPTLH